MAEIRINATGELKLYDSDDSNYVSFKSAGTVSSDITWTLPSADGSSGQVLSTNGSGTLSWATASSADPSSADGDSLGTASAEWSDLYLADGGIIYFGNDQDVTLTHDPDDGLFLKSIATADNNPVLLTLQTGETDIAQDDVIGAINFQAPDEGTGTDAILVAAGIEAVSEGDFSSSSNATKLSFKTGASEAAAEKMSLSSGGNLAVSGTVTTSRVVGDGDTNSYLDFPGSDVIKMYSGGGEAFRITADKDVLLFGPGNLHIYDDHGIVFGDGNDWMIAAAPGESTLEVYKGGTNTTGSNEGNIQFQVGDSANSYLTCNGGEGGDSVLYMYGDQGDDLNDKWWWTSKGTGAELFLDIGENTDSETFLFNGPGRAEADSTWDDNTWDYAELFPWKTALSNDGDINALWGKSVVLDGDFVRIAETGEEAKVIGVVRPKGSTNTHGDGLKWQGKYKQDVWGNFEEEEYTQVTWQEFRDGGVTYRHSYPKDEIPAYRLKKVGRDKNSHKKESNFELDKNGNKIPVVVPSTNAEKTAANYIERTTHKQTGKKLMRRVYSDTYDESISYVKRADRPKEWVLIGMLGQVPVRDSAIIPTHWKKMKNLESGIDKYFIFNK